MLPRLLRVSRCKAPHKTARAQEAKQAKFNFAAKPTKGKKGDYVPKPTAETQTLSGRATKLLGKSAAAKAQLDHRLKAKTGRRQERREPKAGGEKGEKKSGTGANDTAVGAKGAMKEFRSPEDVVFEGRRASSKDGKPKDLKFKGQKGTKKKKRTPKDARGGQRAAKWRASGTKGDK